MPDDDVVRAGGSMWLDALLYDSGQREVELLIADERRWAEDETSRPRG